VEGAMLGTSAGAKNDQFYGTMTTPTSILNGDVALPANKPTLIENIYYKLNKLLRGGMNTPSLEDTKQKEDVAVLAQQASDVVAKRRRKMLPVSIMCLCKVCGYSVCSGTETERTEFEI
jgi:hypothetical protein